VTSGRRLSLLTALASLIVLAMAAPAYAHQPVMEPGTRSDAPARAGDPFPGVHPLPDPVISRAVYGFLEEGAFDVYRFQVSQAGSLPTSLLVPARPELADFRPSYAVIGPGLGGAGNEMPEFVRSRLESAGTTGTLGAVLVPDPGTSPRDTFFEPFARENYYKGGQRDLYFEPGAYYYVVVWDPQGRAGDYVLGLGEKESFGPRAVAAAVLAVFRIKLGLYGSRAPRWGNVGWLAGLLAILAAVVVAIVAGVRSVRHRRRGRRPSRT
jgi:hypothetical protein